MVKISRVVLGGIAAVAVYASQPYSAHATPSLSFFVDGNTLNTPFSIDNTSDAGERVTRFQLDISGPGLVYDNGIDGTEFTPVGGSDVTTGLETPIGSPPLNTDTFTLLDLSFTDFDPGETFTWLLDVDFFGGNSSGYTVFGNQMIGATATIDFSGGQRLLGVLEAVPGNSDASRFTVTGVTTTPPTSVPEPGVLGLLGVGLTSLGGLLYRRRNTE
ncbi:PEP-CTERM sorting domain-containing protein [Rhodospirillaceae bacterium SYSU D60014]|uniref:PEP-CTERM sorting domain-containing protein n=1 Tax=Virgifigura deserti TaxID=2268457 RepID=UPI000E673416